MITAHRGSQRRFAGGDPVERLAAAFRHLAAHEQSLRSSVEFDEAVARGTLLCVTARAQSAGNRRPVPLPLKHVTRRTGDYSYDIALPRAAVLPPMLGLDSADGDDGDSWSELDPPSGSAAAVEPLEATAITSASSNLSVTQIRRNLASARRRQRKGSLPPHLDEPREKIVANNTSSELETHLQLKCLRVERSSLIFKYRSLWIECLDEHVQFWISVVQPMFKLEQKPIAALLLSRNLRMFSSRTRYRFVRSSLLTIQRVCWGYLGRKSAHLASSRRLLAQVVQRMGRGFLDRKGVARSFGSQLYELHRDQSATIIQAKFRMCSARDKFLTLKVRTRCAVKIQRFTRSWLIRLRQRMLRDEAVKAERILQCRMLMTDARVCEAAERATIVCEEADTRETLLGSICQLAAAFARLALVDQLIANDLRYIPCALATSAIATSAVDLTTPLLPSAVSLRSASSAERVPVVTSFRRRSQLQLVRQEQMEAIDRQVNVVMSEQRERTFLRQQHLSQLHALVTV